MRHIKISAAILRPLFKVLDFVRPVADLLARIWVSKIFLQSGLQKINNWDSTVMMFQGVYHVPFIQPVLAAYMGTAFEIILPVLLILGLGGRISIFVFFIYNIVCVASFHFLWTPAGAEGLSDHIGWGLLLLLLMVHGNGKLSLDYLIHTWWGHHLILEPEISLEEEG